MAEENSVRLIPKEFPLNYLLTQFNDGITEVLIPIIPEVITVTASFDANGGVTIDVLFPGGPPSIEKNSGLVSMEYFTNSRIYIPPNGTKVSYVSVDAAPYEALVIIKYDTHSKFL